MMPKGELSCGCSHVRMALYVHTPTRRLGYICQEHARHTPSLRSFLQAASWLYDWDSLRFVFPDAVLASPDLLALLGAVMEQERVRAVERREGALESRIVHAAAYRGAGPAPTEP
jgi:hypothetical protein